MMSLQTPLPSLPKILEIDSDPAQLNFLLAQVCAEPLTHARFLNTLSLLEQMGSRKILLTQVTNEADGFIMKHYAEEARHAYILKRLAEKTAGHKLNYSKQHTIARSSAIMYFNRLEAHIKQLLGKGSAKAIYLFMTTIVEVRALWLYQHYQEFLQKQSIPISLTSLIREEEQHLEEMLEAMQSDGSYDEAKIKKVLAIEQQLFDRLQLAMATKLELVAVVDETL